MQWYENIQNLLSKAELLSKHLLYVFYQPLSYLLARDPHAFNPLTQSAFLIAIWYIIIIVVVAGVVVDVGTQHIAYCIL